MADAIRGELAEGVAAVLFYGSCLRRDTHEGVLDFYVLVDRYRDAYRSWWLATANAVLAPNVFYLEVPWQGKTLRAKYAVLSVADFERAVGPGCLHPYIWARFAQPSLLAWVRDEADRERVEALAAEAVVTLVQRLAVFLPAQGSRQRFSLAALWQQAFARTYTSELRTEAADTVRAIYEADPQRYDATGGAALEVLAERGWLTRVNARERAAEVEMPPGRRRRARWRWRLSRPLAKGIAFVRLLKTAVTFGDWLPYALWKVERHSGTRIELSERQRRHPLIFGWPVIFRLLRRRDLH